MKLTTTLGVFLALAPVLLLGAYLGGAASAFHSAGALGAGILLVCVLELILLTRDRRSTPFDVLLVAIVAAFFIVRLAVLWMAPTRYIYPWLEFAPQDMVRTLLYLSGGAAAAAIGFRLGVGWRPWPRLRTLSEEAPPLRLPMTRLMVVGLTYFSIEAALWVYLGTASSALNGDAPASGGLLFMRHFISLYAATGIGLAVGLDRWHRFGPVRRLQFCAFIGLFVLYTIAAGSRSGLITLTLFAGLYLLIRHGDFRVRPRALAFAVAIALGAVVIFPAATMVRDGWLSASTTQQFTIDTARGLDTSDSWLVGGIVSGLNRLNGLDPLLMITARKEVRPLEEVVSAGQMAKSAVNLHVPSALLGREPFPGVIASSRLFSMVYRGVSLDYINTWYQTDMWTFWGAAFAVGGWSGGLFVMFVVALVLGRGYRLIITRAGKLGLLWRLWWLYGAYLVLISYGFDVDAAAMFSLLVGGTVVVILLRPRAVTTDSLLTRTEAHA